MLEIAEVGKVVRDFGLPLVALIYLFKLYVSETGKTYDREDRYAKIIEANTLSNGQLVIAIQNMVASARAETEVRQELLAKLVDAALAERDQRNSK